MRRPGILTELTGKERRRIAYVKILSESAVRTAKAA